MSGDLRLGILGMSDGNGHPYSWSAIFNGYDRRKMSECPFPTIPDYLGKQQFPRDAIPGARVTHVWTQDRELSQHIAASARIAHVVDRPEAMIGQVDGILLARDDAEKHDAMSRPFLDAGLPIFVDKPLALSVDEAARLFQAQRWDGQLFSCSALRFAAEFRWDDATRAAVGTPRVLRGATPKNWDLYAIHVIDAALGLLGPLGKIEQTAAWRAADVTVLNVRWQNGPVGTFTTTGRAVGPLALEIYGESGHWRAEFHDTFAAFKAALEEFIRELRGPRRGHREQVLEALRLLEAGRQTADRNV